MRKCILPVLSFTLLTLVFLLSGCFLISHESSGGCDTEGGNDDNEKSDVLINNKNNALGFVIVCDKSIFNSTKRASQIRSLISINTDVTLDIVDYTDSSSEYEIIVMETPREISEELKSKVDSYGSEDDFNWGFSYNGKQFAIYADSDYAWEQCISEFKSLFFEDGKMMAKQAEMTYISSITRKDYELELKRKDTHLDPIFTSHAVLQRDKPVILYGTGIGSVSVEFMGNTYVGVTEGDTFTVTLPATPAGGPYSISVNIEGTTTVLEDILFGDVILLAGQSNAELPMDQTDYPADEYTSNDRVRTYFVAQHFSDEFSYNSILDNRWAILDEDEASKWCAIAYHLGNKIENEHDVPVGIICVVKGACVIQSFMSVEAQSSFEFSPDELSIEHPCNTNVDRYKCFNQQAMVYNSMFSKIAPYNVSSVIWYQGESNIGKGESKAYDKLLEALISEWREKLMNESLPFIIVKLHNMGNNDGWLAVREAQERAAVNISNCYLVDLDSLGICKDIHPKNKQEVSELIYRAYYEKLYT